MLSGRPASLSTAAIGSLPHTQLELALQFALRLDVPTLPQLPRADAAEFMLPQALDGLPGLVSDAEGRTLIDPKRWQAGAGALADKLDRALEGEGVEAFEPGETSCRAWKPFVWEVGERHPAFAKAQVTGPLTAAWATTLTDGAPLSTRPEIAAQVVRLVLARALAMTRALAAVGTQPILFLDEPGLYAFDKHRPAHRVELQELTFAAAALRKAGALVGVHCCGNTDWSALFELPLDIVSADARLSLAAELSTGSGLDTFLARGGMLALGIVPTNVAERMPVEDLVANALALMGEKRAAILARSVLTPACGLALRTVAETEQVFDDLAQAQRLLRGR